MIVLNLKTYDKSIKSAAYFAEVASEVVKETGVRVVICPPSVLLRECSEKFSDIFAQHTDVEAPGAFTGSTPAEAVKAAIAKGSLVNHSERKIRPVDNVKLIVERLHQNALESLVCAENEGEAAQVAAYSPTFIAVEPPELIGSGISVSNAKPEVVVKTIKAVKKVNENIPVLCGAGVSNATDVRNALKLGTDGVLLASAFVKSENPKKFLQELAAVF